MYIYIILYIYIIYIICIIYPSKTMSIAMTFSPSGGVRDAARERGSRFLALEIFGLKSLGSNWNAYILVVDRVCWG